jgi:hypothetical protein
MNTVSEESRPSTIASPVLMQGEGAESGKPPAIAPLVLTATDLAVCARIARIDGREWNVEALAEVALTQGWASRVACSVATFLDAESGKGREYAGDIPEAILAASSALLRSPRTRTLGAALAALSQGETERGQQLLAEHGIGGRRYDDEMAVFEGVLVMLRQEDGSTEHHRQWIWAFDVVTWIASLLGDDVDTLSRWALRLTDDLMLRRGEQ